MASSAVVCSGRSLILRKGEEREKIMKKEGNKERTKEKVSGSEKDRPKQMIAEGATLMAKALHVLPTF